MNIVGTRRSLKHKAYIPPGLASGTLDPSAVGKLQAAYIQKMGGEGAYNLQQGGFCIGPN